MSDVFTWVAIAGILGALGGALVMLMVTTTWPNLTRTDCRSCGAELDEPGGCAIVGIGPGFCERCVRRILDRS